MIDSCYVGLILRFHRQTFVTSLHTPLVVDRQFDCGTSGSGPVVSALI